MKNFDVTSKNSVTSPGQSRVGRVLVVDDQPGNLQLIARQLTRHGYEIFMAENWRQARQALGRVDVDLILLDIILPDFDGIEACRRLKADSSTAHIPVIFLSARSDSSDVIRGFRVGAVDYITKPFNVDELLARVEAHLELKLVRQELQETNEKLERSNAQKARMISLIAHDLRNPFLHLRMFPEYVLTNGDCLDPDLMTEVAENALSEVERVSSLLEELVEWSMLEIDSIQVNLHEVHLCGVGSEVLADAAPVAEEKNVRIDCRCDKDLSVLADSKILKTVLRNFVSNGIKFTEPGGEVFINATVLPNGQARISVEDTGTGIDEEHLRKLFNLEHRVSREGTGSEKGHGFGLYLCDQLLLRLNTHICVCSTVDKGSTFFFYLPVLK